MLTKYLKLKKRLCVKLENKLVGNVLQFIKFIFCNHLKFEINKFFINSS